MWRMPKLSFLPLTEEIEYCWLSFDGYEIFTVGQQNDKGNGFSRVCLSTGGGQMWPCDLYPWCIGHHPTGSPFQHVAISSTWISLHRDPHPRICSNLLNLDFMYKNPPSPTPLYRDPPASVVPPPSPNHVQTCSLWSGWVYFFRKCDV